MPLRISGLASGMDIDQMVSELMRAHRTRVDKSYQQKQILQWQREDYRTINSKLLALRNAAFDMKLQGTFMAKSANSSNSNVLTATAGVNAGVGEYSITVHSLASGVTKSSAEALAASRNEDGSAKTLGEQFGLSDSVTFTLQGNVNGEVKEQSFTFDTASQSIYEVVAYINSAGIGIRAGYDSNLERLLPHDHRYREQAEIHVKADAQNFLTNHLKLMSMWRGREQRHRGTDALSTSMTRWDLSFPATSLPLTYHIEPQRGGGQTVRVAVSHDVDAVVEKIKALWKPTTQPWRALPGSSTSSVTATICR